MTSGTEHEHRKEVARRKVVARRTEAKSLTEFLLGPLYEPIRWIGAILIGSVMMGAFGYGVFLLVSALLAKGDQLDFEQILWGIALTLVALVPVAGGGWMIGWAVAEVRAALRRRARIELGQSPAKAPAPLKGIETVTAEAPSSIGGAVMITLLLSAVWAPFAWIAIEANHFPTWAYATVIGFGLLVAWLWFGLMTEMGRAMAGRLTPRVRVMDAPVDLGTCLEATLLLPAACKAEKMAWIELTLRRIETSREKLRPLEQEVVQTATYEERIRVTPTGPDVAFSFHLPEPSPGGVDDARSQWRLSAASNGAMSTDGRVVRSTQWSGRVLECEFIMPIRTR